MFFLKRIFCEHLKFSGSRFLIRDVYIKKVIICRGRDSVLLIFSVLIQSS